MKWKLLSVLLVLCLCMYVAADNQINGTRSYSEAQGVNKTVGESTVAISPVSGQQFFSEDFEGDSIPTSWYTIDSDSDGFDWYIMSDWKHSGNHSIASDSYVPFVGSAFIGALTPDNFLVSPRFAIPATTSSVALDYYVAAYDQDNPAEHYTVYVSTTDTLDTTQLVQIFSETLTSSVFSLRTLNLTAYKGQSIRLIFRHHACTDNLALCIDDISVYGTSTPTISNDKGMIAFNGFVGVDSVVNVNVTGVALSNPVVATTTLPYLVSADGVSYGSQATLGSTLSTLYVKYSPTVEGFTSSEVWLTSTGAPSDTIELQGKASDCSPRVADFEELFSDSSFSLSCWDVVNANNDLQTFVLMESGYKTEHYLYLYRYSEVNDADDWLISPLMSVSAGDSLFLTYKCPFGEENTERFQLYALPENYDLTTPIDTLTGLILTTPDSATQVLRCDMSAFANSNRYIGIHCTSLADNAHLQIRGFALKHFVVTNVPSTAASELAVYPNPVEDVLYFTAPCNRVEIYSLTGELLLTKTLPDGSSSIALGGLVPGMYMLCLYQEEIRYHQLIIKK